MQVYIKNRVRLKTEYQYFMHQFVEACVDNGFKCKKDVIPSYRFHFRALIFRGLLAVYKTVHALFPKLVKRKQALIITANGCTILENVFPYFFGYEIIPMLWDVWPYTWDTLYRDLKLLEVKRLFVTVRAMAVKISKDLGIECYWIPEGIDVDDYSNGVKLSMRSNDILEIGRQHPQYHKVLLQLESKGLVKGLKYNTLHPDGSIDLRHLLYPTAQSLIDDLVNFKIMICFPQSDTNPKRAGALETLTQRYWEAMLSGCLIVGRAPKELIDLIGYNPVVDVEWDSPGRQLSAIIEKIENYQSLVDKNQKVAVKFASWNSRVQKMKSVLEGNGYDFGRHADCRKPYKDGHTDGAQ